jgi:hypothetical protein
VQKSPECLIYGEFYGDKDDKEGNAILSYWGYSISSGMRFVPMSDEISNYIARYAPEGIKTFNNGSQVAASDVVRLYFNPIIKNFNETKQTIILK